MSRNQWILQNEEKKITMIILLLIITVLLQPNTDCHHLGTNARSPNFSFLKVRRLLLCPLQFSCGIFISGVIVIPRLQMTSQREQSETAVFYPPNPVLGKQWVGILC